MKTNCELPLELLHINGELNDYDFILYHLMRDNEEYSNWAKQQRNEKDRLIILDNSAYEFYIKGETLDLNEFADMIMEYEPDYYILPDKIMDKEYTLQMTEKFISFYGPAIEAFCTRRTPKPMAIMQGKSVSDLLECVAKYKELGIECVGVPFHQDFYLDMHIDDDVINEFMNVYENCTTDIRYAMGRVQFVRDNFEILKQFKHVHFLGSHCPLEKVFYSDFQTMDTGYPVKLGYEGVELGSEKCKPKTIIDDFFDSILMEEQKKQIIFNIKKFRNL